VATYNTKTSQAIELEKSFGVRVFRCDFSDPVQTDILLASFEDPLEPFEAAVWTAGVVYPGKLEEVSREEALRTFSVNFWGPYLLLRHARKILPQGGKIILFSSSTSLRASPGLAAYAASKAALNSLALSAAVVAFLLSEAGDALSMFPVRVHMGPYV